MLGFALGRDPDLQQRVVDSTLSQFPVIGSQLSSPEGLHGSVTAVVVGVVACLYGGIGVAQALQNAMNTAWSVARNERPNPFLGRLLSLGLLAIGGLAIVTTTLLTALGTRSQIAGIHLGLAAQVLSVVLSVVVNAALLVVVFRIATARPLSVRQVAPGAICGALAWLLLQSFGAGYIAHVVHGASETNGVFAIVLGMIAWIYLSTVSLVLCVEINVVRVKQFYPRALLTPFTDDIDLTAGDARAYTDAATAQKAKGFESIDVTFNDDDHDSAGRRTQRPD